MALNRPLNTIGGSDIAAIMGASTWKSPLDVYRRIVDGYDNNEDNDLMALGRALESGIGSEYIRRNNLVGREIGLSSTALYASPNRPLWAVASPDGLFTEKSSSLKASHGAEYKVAIHTKPVDWGKEGTDDIPPGYLFQVAWYTWYFDVPYWDIAAILPYRGYQQFRYTRNIDLENTIVSRATEFWHNCQMKLLPPIDGSPQFYDHIKVTPRPEAKPSNPKMDELFLSYLAAKKAVAVNEKEMERCKQELLVQSEGFEIKGDKYSMRSKEWSRKSTSWKSVVTEMVIPDSIIEKHTKINTGVSVEIKEIS